MKELFTLLFHFKLKSLFIERTENTVIQFFRSLFVGGIATLFDFGMTALVKEVFFTETTELNNMISNGSGFVIGLAVNFLLSCLFVFSKSKYGRTREFFVFAAIGLVGLGINNGIVYLFGRIGWLEGILFYLGKVIATLITLVWNFSARKFILYNGSKQIRSGENEK